MDRKFIVSIVCYVLLLVGCNEKIELEAPYLPRDSHDSYHRSLRSIGLADTKLYDLWVEASHKAMDSPVRIKIPFQETVHFDMSRSNAFGYQFEVLRGQKITIALQQLEGDTGIIFMDLFKMSQDSIDAFTHIASADTLTNEIILESQSDQSLVVRIQPELLRTVRYNFKLVVEPSLDFPVSGKDHRAIGSLFGVPRDAGRRVHEGIDIFARRHTPLISVSEGIVDFAGHKEGSLGGNVIWVRDTMRDLVIYYAHLEEIYAQNDDFLVRGDTIGTVGNSGNASTTYPHLHFGIYADGAVDPYPYVVKSKTEPSSILAKSNLLNTLIKVDMRTGTSRNVYSRSLDSYLDHDHYARIVGVTSAYYKVLSAQNDLSYVFYDNIAILDKPIDRVKLLEPALLYSQPDEHAISLAKIDKGETIIVLALTHGYKYCRSSTGVLGWIRDV